MNMNKVFKKSINLARTVQKKSISICNNNKRLAQCWVYFNIRSGISSAILSRLFFQKFKDIHPELSIQQAENAINYFFDPSFNSVYANRLEKLGRIEEARKIKEQIIDLELVKPQLKNIDSVFKTLSNKGHSDLAEKWASYLLKDNASVKHAVGRKYFIYFKDIDIPRSIAIGESYLMHKPSDEKFAAVYLKRAEGIISDEKHLLLIKKLNTLHASDFYLERLEHTLTKMRTKVLSKDNITENRLIELLESNESKSVKLSLCKFLFDKSENFHLKKICANYIVNNIQDADHIWIKKIADYHLSKGSISKSLEILSGKENILLAKKSLSISSFYNLFKNGYEYPSSSKTNNYRPITNRVQYLLHNRLPYNSGGYATRSHGLLTSIKQWWDISGVSRLGYPQDRKGLENAIYTQFHDIDNVRYHCLQANNNAFGQIPVKEYIDEYSNELYNLSLMERPSIIHAASNYMNGLAANNVARRLGIKSVYEVRGLWEITRISRDPQWKDTEYYNMMVQLEAQAAKDADAVFTLTDALKKELITRGVSAEKIHLLPNGVDSSRFIPKERNNTLALQLGIKDKVVIGFLGSVVQYEGVEYIIQAASILKKRGIKDFAVLIVGDGAVLNKMKTITSELDMENYVTFTGRVPHDEIEDYYSVVDICPLPRKGLPVCEMVSPLKPFEAMSMGKVVVSSDVAALAEIINDEVTGLLHKKDDPEDLANKISQLITNHELRNRLGLAAREWVVAERDWKVIAKRVDNVYRSLLGK